MLPCLRHATLPKHDAALHALTCKPEMAVGLDIYHHRHTTIIWNERASNLCRYVEGTDVTSAFRELRETLSESGASAAETMRSVVAASIMVTRCLLQVSLCPSRPCAFAGAHWLSTPCMR